MIRVQAQQLSTDSLNIVTDSLTQSLPDSLGLSIPPDSLGGDSLGQKPASPEALRQQQIIDSLKANSDLQTEVAYNAQDSIVFDLRTNILTLFGQTSLDYDDINLQAPEVQVDIKKQELFARGRYTSDSTAREGLPQFSQGEESYQAKTMAYNFTTQKARVTGGRLVQEDIYVQADVAKYQPDGSFHGADGKFTTCDLEDPHFHIRARKLKVLPNRQIITGPLRPVIADFPLPILLPFGFIPGNLGLGGKQRGIIQPQYGNAQDRGFFLRNLGYYLPINEYLDLSLDGDIYTRGGWRIGATTNYKVRYRFSGNFNFQYGIQRFNEPTDPDFARTAAWSLRWNHNQPIDPTARISSSVNISSSRQFRQVNVNDPNYFSNNLNSSINFQKSFNNLPFSFNLSARHQQDLNKGTVSMQLPEFSFNLNRQSPFRSIRAKPLGFLRQLGITYNMQARNSLQNVPDSLFVPILFAPADTLTYNVGTENSPNFVSQPGRDFFQRGLQHNANASTNVKLLKYINISPSMVYREVWYLESLRKVWDPDSQEIVEFNQPGFARGYEFSGSVGASTNFYGIYQLTRTKRELAFRQRFTPTVSYNIRPDFSDERWGFYREVQNDTLGNIQEYSIFEDGIYGGPSRGESQAISFSLNSVVEMKYLKKNANDPDFDEKDKYERANLIDNLGVSTSYNFAADSFQLSTITLNGRTSLLNRKITLNTSATMDPYMYGYDPVDVPVELGAPRRMNTFLVQETGQLARLTRAQVSLSTSFRAKQDQARGKGGDNFNQEEYNEVTNTYYQYVDFAIPWSVNLRYNLSYNRPGFDASVNSSLNVSGDLRFGQSWKIQYTTGYDLVQQEFANTTFSIFKDLHCWQMSFRWIPFGPRKSYSIVLSAKSSTLSALRLSKNDFWTDRFQ